MSLGSIDPASSALCIVDMQNDFCHPRGALARQGVDVFPPMREVVPEIQQLIRDARDLDVPIIFAVTHHGVWTNSAAWLGRRLSAKGSVGEVAPICAEGRWGSELYEVAPTQGDRIIVKHRYSAFHATELDLILRARGLATLALCGIATNVCVEATARDAFMRDYRVLTISDCCSANSADEHRSGLFNLDRYFGQVVTSASLLAAWGRSSSRASTTA